jgi:Mrp family chromosome partitioning ATPase
VIALPRRKPAPPGNLDTQHVFRDLYTRVLLSLQGEEHVVLGVTSAIAGEGKTTIATGLAATLAQEGTLHGAEQRPGNVLLVDCNQGQRAVTPELAVAPGPGLIQVLRGDCPLEFAIRPSGYDQLHVLPLGEPASAFPLLIRGATLSPVLAEIRRRFALSILDLPAVLTSTDTRVLAGLADRLLLVVRAGVTPTKLVRQALDELAGTRVLGTVLNDSRRDLPAWLEQRL